ncbi:MAG: 4-(cytidine 5'-diphospho)-2-C-methyl-D-erythritol kinase [Planctomycetaceae bacterium]
MVDRSTPIQLDAPAKLNLSLSVLCRRDDGFHGIESLMVGLRLAERLTIASVRRAVPAVDGPVVRLVVRHAGRLASGRSSSARRPIPTDGGNLVVKAVLALAKACGETRGLDIELIKRIPAAAGLGGGSSDAAAAIRGAAMAWGIDWPSVRLADVAAEIGSDVPWFVESMSAIARGRGERLERVTGVPPLFAVVACPSGGLSTADVYRHCEPDAAGEGLATRVARAFDLGSLREAFDLLHNDLEAPARGLCADLERLIGSMQRATWGGGRLVHRSGDASRAMVTGSGSACFLLTRSACRARAIAARIGAEGWPWVVVTRLAPFGSGRAAATVPRCEPVRP